MWINRFKVGHCRAASSITCVPEHHFLLDSRCIICSQNKKIIRKIIQVDLDAVVKGSDYLIVNWDKSVFKGGGTHGEITMAYWFNKPIYMVNALPIEDVSSWIFSCTEYICSNFEDLKIKLKEIY